LRYANAVYVNGRACDMVVTNMTEYQVNNASRNTDVSGGMANINVLIDTKVRLKYQFYYAGTTEKCVVPEFPITFYDVDQFKNGKAKETVTICGAKEIIQTENSVLDKTTEGGCDKMESTQFGVVEGNPTSNMGLTDEQKSFSFTAMFDNTDSFELELEVGPHGKGRNFLFAGMPAVGPECPVTTTTTTTTGPIGICTAYGDPHGVTFDGSGQFWAPRNGRLRMVKGKDLDVQLKLNHRGYATEMAIQIPDRRIYVKEHAVINKGQQHKWNDYFNDGVVQMVDSGNMQDFVLKTRAATGGYRMNDVRNTAPQAEKEHLKHNITCLKLLELNSDVCFRAYAWDPMFPWGRREYTGLEVLIKMHQQPGLSGWCGNFNSNWNDDALDGQNPTPDLFNMNYVMLEAEASETPSPCDDTWRAKAKEACKDIVDELEQQSCEYDVCVMKKTSVAQAEKDEEALEIVDARDDPEVVVINGKSGKCVDNGGNLYAVTDTKKVSSAVGCEQELKAAAEPEGALVIGAQFSNGNCELLKGAPGTDGIVFGVDASSEWTCYRVWP